MPLEETVANNLTKYRYDELMLDGFMQWAMNPNAKNVGYGLNENSFLIVMNLHERYGLLVPQVEEKVKKVEEECSKIVANSGCDDIGAIRSEILKQLKSDLGRELFVGIARRLEKAPDQTMKTTALLYTLKAKGLGGKTWESFEDWLPDGFKTSQGYTYLQISIRKSLIKVGLLDRLFNVIPEGRYHYKLDYYLLELPLYFASSIPIS